MKYFKRALITINLFLTKITTQIINYLNKMR
ncbi:hypothetical protein SAMN05444360_108185 [Chryseobacterium carnipullorum]|nr:hypothetical protein SAMN05444360_108185 [Chryseobacterium carnipullorum]